ncbi:glycosyltransferase family 4 protein [Haloarcula onubensis]|uniref:Glycosyltransferase family 4 protein n=1 Tax=Haloarcula onubensis TaxID=2950539 RepID=A0ABU2FPF2_9EURY|nr:glycosyltransferase family 4 protein [Halomicroarcula sp. S3CR25-11]MDS0282644.1 glycosyltransferase family 4 protein [Halomicroarcula sp. S3CR25-11]
MRVLHLTTGRRSFFEQQVAALRDSGVDCTVLEVPGDYAADDPRSVVDYLRYYPQVVNGGLGGYDLVHANNGLTVPFALAQPTGPVVATFWGSDLMGERGWLGRLSRFGASMVDRVILPSERLSAYVDCPYTHVPFPVDTELFRPIDRATARTHVGWDPDESVVLFPYDPDRPEKDYERARNVVAAADTDAKLRTLTGKSHAEMPYYLNASDAVLVTSKRESGPMVVREAAACNVPVVSTDVGFVAETLADVNHSFVCRSDLELAGALEHVLDAAQRSAARDRVPELGPDQFGRRLQRVYRSVAEEAVVPA